jgi:hypothetical protein
MQGGVFVKIHQNLDENIAYLEGLFADANDVVKRKFPVGPSLDRWAYIIYIDGMVDRQVLEDSIMPRLTAGALKTHEAFFHEPLSLLKTLKDGGMFKKKQTWQRL